MDSVTDDDGDYDSVYPKGSRNLDQFLHDPLLLEPASPLPQAPVVAPCRPISPSIANLGPIYRDELCPDGSCMGSVDDLGPFYREDFDRDGTYVTSLDDLEFDVFECRPNDAPPSPLGVVNHLPDLLKTRDPECLQKVVPKVQEVLSHAEADIQRAASSAFLQILQKEQVPVQNYAQMFLETILTSIDNKNPDISSAWLGTLLDVIELLPKNVVQKEILAAAKAKGQLSQSIQARLSCCQILGKIVTKFDPFVIKKEILPMVQSLCQDVAHEVRGSMCLQLDLVSRGLGLEATKSSILPELVELTNDEEVSVRIAGLETTVDILTLLDAETCSSTIVPLVIRFYQQCLTTKDQALPVVAKHIGRICHGLSKNLDDSQKQWFVSCYEKLCRMGLTEKDTNSNGNEMKLQAHSEQDLLNNCRINAAFNFPAMSLFVGSRDFESSLLEIFTKLCGDPLPAVRKSIAYGFHEVMKQMELQPVILLKNFGTLLSDKSIEVLGGICSHLSEIFEVLRNKKISEEQSDGIISALMSAESVLFSSYSWRLQETFVLSLSSLQTCFDSETILVKIMPMLTEKVKKARTLPVKLAVARTFLTLLRSLNKADDRETLITNLTEDMFKGNCHQRSLLLEMSKISLEINSKAFFKEIFFDRALALSNDPVPNIRLKLCRFLPTMKTTLNLPEDNLRLSDLLGAIEHILENDTDSDVLFSAKQAICDLENIVIPVNLLESKSQVRGGQTAEDLVDQKREEEEKSVNNNDDKADEKTKVKKDVPPSSKIPSPRKVSGPKPPCDKQPSPTPPKDLKKALGKYSASTTSVSSPKVKSKASSIPNCRLVKSQSTSAISSSSLIPKPDAKTTEPSNKKDTKIPVIGTSSLPIPKEGKPHESRSTNSTRIPRVSTPVRPPSPIPTIVKTGSNTPPLKLNPKSVNVTANISISIRTNSAVTSNNTTSAVPTTTTTTSANTTTNTTATTISTTPTKSPSSIRSISERSQITLQGEKIIPSPTPQRQKNSEKKEKKPR
ncbi:serine/threonine-protein phosphatase 4 regulatory subunit 4-like [Argonauta hians]